MARLVERLTAMAVNRASKPGYYSDGAGLYLQVSATGSKSWIFRYVRGKKESQMGLGPLHTVTLAKAREKARDCRAMLLDGQDPLEQRRSAQASAAVERTKAVTFDECASAYISAHRSGWKNAKTAPQWESSLAAYASPIIGPLPVGSVDTALVVKVLQPIWSEKTITATRVRARIESILDWATVSKFRTGENPARWRGHLDHLLANPDKVTKVAHHPALPWQEIGAFLVDLRLRKGSSARALEFTILTAARSGEARGARWDEIDMHSAIWTVPAERMKAGREHRVPLSAAAIALLEALPKVGDYLFPGQSQGDGDGSTISNVSMNAVLKRMGRSDITVHGFRSTFRDWCAESVGNSFPREVCEHALAHSLPDKVEAAYRRGDLIEKRKVLMQVWADYCSKLPRVAGVESIRRQTAV